MDVLILGQYAGAGLAILGLLGVVFRLLVLLPLKAYIKELTYPIQPYANGGKSLPDIAKGIDRLNDRLELVEKRLDTLES